VSADDVIAKLKKLLADKEYKTISKTI